MLSKKVISADGTVETINVPNLSLLASSPMSQLPPDMKDNDEYFEENEEAVTFCAEELVNFLNVTLKYYKFDSVSKFATCQVVDSVKSNIKAAQLMEYLTLIVTIIL